MHRGIRRHRQRAADHRQQFLQVERLGQIFEGAALGRLHRRHQRRLRAHHHHAQVRADALDARDQVQPVLVRHHHVGDHQVALAILHPAPQRRGVAGACAPGSPSAPAPGSARCGSSGRHRRPARSAASSLCPSHGNDAASLARLRREDGDLGPAIRFVVVEHRQMQAEFGAAGPAVHLDQPAMVADDLGDQRQPQAAAGRLGADERLEQMRRGCPRGCPARCRAPLTTSGRSSRWSCPARASRMPC